MEILVYKILPEIIKSKIFTRFNFIAKLKRAKVLNLNIFGCILYTKILD